MGNRVARRFLGAGFAVCVRDRDQDAVAELVACGARSSESSTTLAEQVDAMFPLLENDAAVREVVIDSGLLGVLPAGGMSADLSTTSTELASELVEVGTELGVGVLDIAMSGSTEQVEAGELVLLVGGDEALLEEMRPLLASIVKTVSHLGGPGAGTNMKLVVNTMLGVEMQALAEAIAFGEAVGLDRDRTLDAFEELAVLAAATGQSSQNGRRDEHSFAFALRLMHKDFGLIFDRAAASGLELPAAAASAAVCASTLEAEDEDVDFSAVIREMQQLRVAQLSASDEDRSSPERRADEDPAGSMIATRVWSGRAISRSGQSAIRIAILPLLWPSSTRPSASAARSSGSTSETLTRSRPSSTRRESSASCSPSGRVRM
jgi:3-hydroxyisobutyrate dehydrogenase